MGVGGCLTSTITSRGKQNSSNSPLKGAESLRNLEANLAYRSSILESAETPVSDWLNWVNGRLNWHRFSEATEGRSFPTTPVTFPENRAVKRLQLQQVTLAAANHQSLRSWRWVITQHRRETRSGLLPWRLQSVRLSGILSSVSASISSPRAPARKWWARLI